MKIHDIYSISELKKILPFGAEDNFHISIIKYGYLHDTGLYFQLIPIQNGERPKGWKTLHLDFEKKFAEVQNCWDYAIKFGYNGV